MRLEGAREASSRGVVLARAGEGGGEGGGEGDGKGDGEDNYKNSSNETLPAQQPRVGDAMMAPSSPASSPLTPSEIRTLRDSVFGLDTFFVQTVDNYGESGVLFKGNIRSGADPSAVQQKLQSKLSAALPGYSLYLMIDREDKPTVVVIRDDDAGYASSDVGELLLAVVLALATIVTTLNVFDGEIFNAALLVASFQPDKILAAVPGSLAFLAALAAHEVGHVVAAKKHSVELSPPIVLPAGLGLLGSFGAITRIRSPVQNRQVLSDVIGSGPVYGLSVSLVLTVLGLILTKVNVGGSVELDSASFAESLLVGGLSSVMLGREVFTAESISCSSLFIAGWAGLIVNSINLIPAGELDGGKLSLASFGRPAAQFLSVVSFVALGVGSFVNGLALFWLLLVLTVQRGPGIPCREEVSGVNGRDLVRNVVLMVLALAVLMPFPGVGEVRPEDLPFSPF